MAERIIIGVDEAGRGPLCGPVSLGIVAIAESEYEKIKSENIFPAGKDSKKMTEKQREKFFGIINDLKTAGRLRYGVFFESAKIIDQRGIAVAIRLAIGKGFKSLGLAPELAAVKLDGGLKAPMEYQDQETIIEGDEKEQIIGLASICAKVLRDHLMLNMHKKYPQYRLDKHKGYGTKAHYEALSKHGPCPEHRKSFLHLPKK